ncbi:MAG: hypothetical protein K2W96_20380 [Gemmataceae bacterium]|nr:hypothetical protein [Gemmataceae bacterium]
MTANDADHGAMPLGHVPQSETENLGAAIFHIDGPIDRTVRPARPACLQEGPMPAITPPAPPAPSA